MTKKDYELIASVLRDQITTLTNIERIEQSITLAYLFADRLGETNAQFNTERFLEACGVDEQ